MRDFQTSNVECPSYTKQLFSANRNYVDLWFHRRANLESQLDPTEKNLLHTNLIFVTLAKGFYSVRKNQLLDEQWIYNSFNNSLMVGSPASTISLDFYYQDCIKEVFSEPYDPRCRPWYSLAMNNEGIQFQQPYVYAFDNSIGMTASSKILDGNGQLQSVLSIDFGITNLVTDIFAKQDQNDSSSIYEAYSVFFHEQNRTIFYHKNWNRSSGNLYNWEDIEFNETSNYPNRQKIDFSDQLTEAIRQSSTLDNFYDFNQIQNTNLFLNFAKGDRNYTALVYPIESFSINQKNDIEKKSVMFLARVQRNIVELILKDVLKYNQLFQALAITEIVIVIFVLIISLCHFTAVLMHQISIPIDQLTNFLKHSSLLIKQQKKNDILEINNQLQQQQKHQLNQSFIFSTQLRVHQQTIVSQQLRDSFGSNNALNAAEYSKSKFLVSSIQPKDKVLAKQPFSPSLNFQQQLAFNRRMTNNELKIDNQLFSLPTKNLETDKMFTPNRRDTQNTYQKSRRLTETQQGRSKENYSEFSKKIIDNYRFQQMGDIKQLKSSFKEFSVIKKTFKILANIIQFQRDGFYASDNSESLLKFTKAYKIFNKIQNQQALTLCLFNIGNLHQESRRYEDAIECYQLSQNICFQQLGQTNIQSFQSALEKGNIFSDQFYLNLLRNISKNFGLLLKQKLQDNIISQYSISKNNDQIKFNSNKIISENNYYNMLQKELIEAASLSLKLLNFALNIEKKLNPINKFNLMMLHIDIAESFIYLGDLDQSLYHIKLVQRETQLENSQNATDNDEQLFRLASNKEIKQQYQQTNQIEINLLFIRGLLEMKRGHYCQAATLFTDMIENAITCDPQKKLLAFSLILFTFINAKINTEYIIKFLLKEKHIYFRSLLQQILQNQYEQASQNKSNINQKQSQNFEQKSFDTTIIFQTPSFQSQLFKEFENYQLSFVDWLFKFFLQPHKDRIQILNCYEDDKEPYSKQLDVIQHLNVFKGDQILKVIGLQYQQLNKEFQNTQIQLRNQKLFIDQVFNKSSQTPNNCSKAFLPQVLTCIDNYNKLKQQYNLSNFSTKSDSFQHTNQRTHFIIFFSNYQLDKQLQSSQFQQRIEQIQNQNKDIKNNIIIINPCDLLSFQNIESNEDLIKQIFLEKINNEFKLNYESLMQNSIRLDHDRVYNYHGLKIHQFESISQFKIYLLRKRMHPSNIQYLKE